MNANPLPEKTRTGSDNCLGIGTRVGEFEITGIIGEGGFGIVYLAFDHSLQRTIALKEYMPPALAGRGGDNTIAVRSKRHQETFEAGLKSFINEARLLAQFDHPALIKVHRFWEQNNTAYMAMRYYEGRTLKDIIRDEPGMATEAWWKSVLKPILEALGVLYSVQILHRDISPENIMIQPTGEPVLLDFGAARQLIQNSTQALTVILKPGYAPVEQYADDTSMQQGPWTDIYALSAVVYSSIARKAPPASVARMIKDPMEPLTPDGYPGYSRQFLFAISKGLAVKPEDRPQTIAEFSQLLGLDKPGSGSPAGKDRRKSDSRSKISQTTESKEGKGDASGKPRRQPGEAPATAITAFIQPKWIMAAAGVICLAALALYVVNPGKSGTPADSAAASASAAESQSNTPAPEDPAESGAVPVAATAAVASPSGRQTASPSAEPTASAAAMPGDRKTSTAPADNRKVAAAPPQTAARQPGETVSGTGTMHVHVKPWGNILVNGVPKGVSPPLKSLVLPEGKHQIRLVNPNYRDHVVDIDITNRKAVSIDYDFSKAKN
jgi:serine/threonine protein kinase